MHGSLCDTTWGSLLGIPGPSGDGEELMMSGRSRHDYNNHNMFSSRAQPKLQGLRGCWAMAEAIINFLGTGSWGRLLYNCSDFPLICPGSWISLAIGELMCRLWHYSLTALWFPKENNINCIEYYRKGGSRKWNLVIPIVINTGYF